MSPTTGNSFHGKRSDVTSPAVELDRGKLMLLLGLGVAIVALGELFRFPLGLPGRHGLEAMALLATARLCTNYRWAATVAAASAATTAVVLGAGHGGVVPTLYILPGLVIDIGMIAVPAWRTSLLWLPLLAAAGHATKPIAKWIALQGASPHFGSMAHGLPYPLTTHLLFGFTGALVATLAWRARQKAIR